MVLVKCLKVVEKCYLNWIFSLGALFCCLRYSNIEYQDDIFQNIIKKTAQKVMAKFGFGL
jgi:hypothetical protein